MGLHARNQFDDLFDGALQHYGNVEPRAGLEGRLLASLATAQRQAVRQDRWIFAFAMAGCMCVVLTLCIVVVLHHQRGVIEVEIRTALAPRAQSAEIPASAPAAVRQNPRVSPRHKTQPMFKPRALPQMSQFPSPRPLSQQEQLLKAYVAAFPQEATMIAREQTQREQEFEKLVSAQHSNNDSEQ